MKLPILLAAISAALAGCTGSYSVVAQKPGPIIPGFYFGYSGGIVARPTDAQVARAVRFGSAAKDNPGIVKDVNLSKADTSAAASEALHIIVRTPLHLISRHAMERARKGRAPDPKFIAFARRLGLVRLAVSQRYISLATWDDYAIDRELSLLRDGVRVAPASSMPAWNGVDPFFDPDDPSVSWQAPSWLKHGVEDMDSQSLRQSEESSAVTGGANEPNTRRAASIELEPDAAVFPIEELRKPGRYEVVLRKPHPGSPGSGSTPGVRISISFARFP